MNRKKTGFLFISLGIILSLLINLLDFIRGKEFNFGPVQAIVTLLGFLVVILGIFITFTHVTLPHFSQLDWNNALFSLENLFSRINSWFNSKLKPGTFDIVVITAFALFSLTYTLGRWNGITPFIYLGSDASYISSYAAALDNPNQFINDYFLSNQAHVSSYFALHIPLLRFLNKIIGSYGNAFLVLLPVALFFKLFGFYVLGKKLLKNRVLGLILAIVSFPIVYTGVWDYWGLIGDALPRNLFDILFPWLILWSIEWIDSPKQWYFLSLILGLSAYIHSISAGVIFTVLCFIYLIQSPAPISKRIGQLLISITIFIAAITPFVLVYSSSRSAAKSIPISYQETLTLLTNEYGDVRFNLLGIFTDLIKTLTNSGILPVAFLALLFLVITDKIKTKGAYRTICVWILGICLVAIVLPYLERTVDPWLHLISVQMMLPRGLRYLPPLLTLFTLLAFFDQTKKNMPKYPAIVGILATVSIAISFVLTVSFNQQDPYFGNEIKCLVSGNLVCPDQEELDAVDIIEKLDTYTTDQDRILAAPPLNVKYTNSIRYQALRDMGYTRSDVTRMSDDPALQKQISATMKPWNKLEHADEDTVLASYLELAPVMQGDYLIVQLDDFTRESVKKLDPVYANTHYALVKVGK